MSTVGRDDEAIRKYIKEHEREDQRRDQLNMFTISEWKNKGGLMYVTAA